MRANAEGREASPPATPINAVDQEFRRRNNVICCICEQRRHFVRANAEDREASPPAAPTVDQEYSQIYRRGCDLAVVDAGVAGEIVTAGFGLRSNVLLRVMSHGAALKDVMPASARTMVDIAEGYGRRFFCQAACRSRRQRVQAQVEGM